MRAGKSLASTVTVYADIYRQLYYNPTTDLAPVSLAAAFVHGIAIGGACTPPSEGWVFSLI